jgi:hypothetical protein
MAGRSRLLNLLAVLSLAVACRQPAEVPRTQEMPTASDDQSVRVMAQNDIPAGSWLLDIRDDGTARLLGYHREQHFSIPGPRMAELRAALVAGELDSLPETYGTMCDDCPRCRLLVVHGEKKHTISLWRFRHGPPTPAQRREARRALDLWIAVKKAAGQLELPDVCTDMLGGDGQSAVQTGLL